MTKPPRPAAPPRAGTASNAKGRKATPAQAPRHRAAPAPAARAEAPRRSAAFPASGMQLHTAEGARKYLTAGERDAFLRAAERADRQVRTLCMTLAYAGCRLSEALALTADRVDLAAGVLVFESLKKAGTNELAFWYA